MVFQVIQLIQKERRKQKVNLCVNKLGGDVAIAGHAHHDGHASNEVFADLRDHGNNYIKESKESQRDISESQYSHQSKKNKKITASLESFRVS